MIIQQILTLTTAYTLKAEPTTPVEKLEAVSNVGYVLAVLMFIVAILLFFLLKIPAVYGDLSGKAAKKAIEKIKLQNEAAIASGAKAFSPSTVNLKKGKTSGKLKDSRQLFQTPPPPVPTAQPVMQASTQVSAETVFLNAPAVPQTYQHRFIIERDITFINTDEVIQ